MGLESDPEKAEKESRPQDDGAGSNDDHVVGSFERVFAFLFSKNHFGYRNGKSINSHRCHLQAKEGILKRLEGYPLG